MERNREAKKKGTKIKELYAYLLYIVLGNGNMFGLFQRVPKVLFFYCNLLISYLFKVRYIFYNILYFH